MKLSLARAQLTALASRMEEQDWETRIQESPSQGSKVRFILEKGWCLGKKIAITSVAISSAPFVLPPLVVFSTLGVAFAVPFGFVFASYVCTEKIMSRFFPMPVSPPILGYKTWEEEEEEYMEDVKQGLETRNEMVGDGKSRQDEAEIVAEEEIRGQQGGFGVGKEKPTKGKQGKPTRVVMGIFKGKTVEKRDEKHAKKRANKLVGESKGKGIQKRGEENGYKNKDQGVKTVLEMEKMAEERRIEEDAHNIAVVEKRIEEKKVIIRTRSDQGIMEDEKKPIEDTANSVVHPVSSYAAKFDSAKGASRKGTVIPSRKVRTKFIPIKLVEKLAANMRVPGTYTHSPPRVPPLLIFSVVLLSEEKIWEQIDAMRTIVGFKATRKATCIEELKALYLFSGVEPPTSFRVSSDIVEVNDKLRFLMSMVGVK